MATEIHAHTIESLGRAYRSGELSPTDVTEAMLERIRRVDARLHSYVHVATEFARRTAQQAEDELAAGLDRGPLHGVPIAFKDLIFCDEMPTTAGMAECPPWWRTGTATIFQRARAAGAVVLGTVATTEGMYSDYQPHRRTPLNPWGDDLWVGASSSGSGVATAAQLCFGAFGSDTGGSIRYPSAVNGVTGLKPTWGRVSRFGAAPLAPSLGHLGPMARTARDAQLMLEAVEGFDRLDPTTARRPASRAEAEFASPVGMKIGIDRDAVSDMPREVATAMDSVLDVLIAGGARIVEVTAPRASEVRDIWHVITSVEAGVEHGEWFERNRSSYGPGLTAFLDGGAARTTQELLTAQMAQVAYRMALADMFETVDAFLCPVIGLTPTIEEWHSDSPQFAGEKRMRYTMPFNLSGTPTITFPAGLDSRGAPIGLQLCGKAFQEGMLTNVVAAIQARTDWHLQRPL